jgi:hypothetical protein
MQFSPPFCHCSPLLSNYSLSTLFSDTFILYSSLNTRNYYVMRVNPAETET